MIPIHRHLFWRALDGRWRSDIEIPEDQTESMLIKGTVASLGSDSSHLNLPMTTVPGFYIDTTEVTVGDCRRVANGRITLDDRLYRLNLSDEHAIPLAFDYAMVFAERFGKRLPSALEYRFAATNRGESRFPWGDAIPEQDEEPKTFGPVGDAIFDAASHPNGVRPVLESRN
jgi:formylglycine-generating enzyme required for sulfatase activity